jgi:hypothetical protein
MDFERVQEKFGLMEEKLQSHKALAKVQQEKLKQQEAAAKAKGDYLASYNAQMQAAIQVRKTTIPSTPII